jgi:hypothetical protein
VTLVRSSSENTEQAGEFIKEIREAIESSAISKAWSVDKVTILGEPDLIESNLSPAHSKKVP